jgi:hypothetical protein
MFSDARHCTVHSTKHNISNVVWSWLVLAGTGWRWLSWLELSSWLTWSASSGQLQPARACSGSIKYVLRAQHSPGVLDIMFSPNVTRMLHLSLQSTRTWLREFISLEVKTY